MEDVIFEGVRRFWGMLLKDSGSEVPVESQQKQIGAEVLTNS
jgi:hypothetical protein